MYGNSVDYTILYQMHSNKRLMEILTFTDSLRGRANKRDNGLCANSEKSFSRFTFTKATSYDCFARMWVTD